MRPALVLALLLSAQAVQADRLELGVLAASVADLASTEYGIRSCSACYESNPLLRSTGSRAAIKAASGALVIVGTRKLAETHPKAAKALKVGLIVLYSGATANNLRRAR